MKFSVFAAVIALAAGFSLAGNARAQTAGDIDQLLKKADTVRSVDPKAFGASLDQLDQWFEKASIPQRDHVRLLRAYRQAYGGDYVSAVESARTLYEESKVPTIKFRAALLVVNSTAASRDFVTGLRFLERMLDILPSVSDKALRHQALGGAALLYNQLGQYEQGKHYAELLLADNPVGRNLCLAHQLQFEAEYGLTSKISNETAINDAIDQCAKIGEAIAANLLRGYLARSWGSRGHPDRAVALLSVHVDEVEATRYPRLIGEHHALLAQYLWEEKRLDDAVYNAQLALAASKSNRYSLPRLAAYQVLHEVALARGDLAGALDYYRRYAETDKAYLDDVKARELAFQESRNELQQKDQAIELLSKQNEVLKLEQEVSKKSAQNTRLLMLLLGVVLAVIGYWAYKIKRVQIAFRRLAQTDGLTAISNRRHFRDEADAMLKRAAASGKDAALVLLDLDNFKSINDRHGHSAGDWVLTQVAEACKAVCRDGDLCGRLGGEEFGILAGGGDIEAARRIAERCRENLAAIDGASVGLDAPVTASFGCTSVSRSGYNFEALFSAADTAMYQAKSSGRDRVVVHGDSEPHSTACPAILPEQVAG